MSYDIEDWGGFLRLLVVILRRYFVVFLELSGLMRNISFVK